MIRFWRWTGILVTGVLASFLAWGQGYPAKPVKLIVPFTAGSATDILARTVGQKLSDLWGQPVYVENRAGAGGTIGAAVVAKSPPDGLTLMVHSSAQAVNAYIYPTLPYDTLKDFVQVAPLGGQPGQQIELFGVDVRAAADSRRGEIELAGILLSRCD